MKPLSSLVQRAAFASVVGLCLWPATASGEADLPPKGTVEVKSYSVAGSSVPKIVARAVMDVPAKKLWQIVSDCEHYKGRLPRVAASTELKKEGNVHTCKVTIAMPFPFSNLTAVTEAVHEENDSAMSRRWKLVSGDYKINQGSWEIKALDKTGTSTLVTYTVHAEPNTSVPDFIRESAQKKAIPEMIERVAAEAKKLP
jgi:ribosome-associated toxin RatA of RatAB toxin-antitoxin module